MTRWLKSIIFVGAGLLVFTAVRVALYFIYPEVFSALSAKQTIFSFVDGIRFDLSILLTVFALFLTFFNIPVNSANSRLWQGIWGWGMYVVLMVLTLLLVGDVIYFGDVKHHMTSELLVMGNDTGFLVEMALGSYKLQLALFVLFAVLLAVVWKKILTVETNPSRLMPVKFILFAGLMVLGIRGTFSDKPINIIDAFESGSAAQSNLVLNGAFTLYHHARATRNGVNHHFFSSEEAQRIARTPLNDGKQPHPHLNPLPEGEETIFLPPLQGEGRGGDGVHKAFSKQKHYNVVLILLESWSPFYIDSFGNNNFGVTPNFDRLANNGLQFTRFYAVGQRSIEGIQASLTGLPPLIGLPNLGFGLEAKDFPRIGNVLKTKGYETIFMQSSRRRSFRVDAIARATGFEQYYGMEDMPMLLNYEGQKSTFGWDYESMMFLKSKLDATKNPFFAFLFTGTTHMPYINPGKELAKYSHDPKGENGFLNTLHYSDWSLGRFMEDAARSPWFDNTIFIFTADHNYDAFRSFSYHEKFHIPLVIYAPGLFKHQKIETVGSQSDISPTILDLLGIDEQFASVGSSLLRKDDEFAYLCDKNSIGIISDRGYICHTLKNRLEAGGFPDAVGEDYLARLEKKLLALDQVMSEMVTANKWGKKQ